MLSNLIKIFTSTMSEPFMLETAHLFCRITLDSINAIPSTILMTRGDIERYTFTKIVVNDIPVKYPALHNLTFSLK